MRTCGRHAFILGIFRNNVKLMNIVKILKCWWRTNGAVLIQVRDCDRELFVFFLSLCSWPRVRFFLSAHQRPSDYLIIVQLYTWIFRFARSCETGAVDSIANGNRGVDRQLVDIGFQMFRSDQFKVRLPSLPYFISLFEFHSKFVVV